MNLSAKSLPSSHAIPFIKTIASLLLVTCATQATAATQSYSLCPFVRTVYLSDPLHSRALVVNYDEATGNYIFLRCGESDELRPTRRVQELNCHVVLSGSEAQLCRYEQQVSQVSKVIGELVDAGVSTLVSGGLSNFSKASRAVGLYRDLRLPPQCLGVGMMKAMALNTNSGALQAAYYDAQTEIGPLTQVTRLATRRGDNRQSYIYSQLDSIIYSGPRNFGSGDERKVRLTGPAYFTARRDNQGIDHMVLDGPNGAAFCGLFGPRPVSAAESTVSR